MRVNLTTVHRQRADGYGYYLSPNRYQRPPV